MLDVLPQSGHRPRLAPVVSDEWREIVRQSPAMMHSVDGCGRLIEVSDEWLRVLGYRRDEVIGRFSGEFLTDASRIYSHEVLFPTFSRTGVLKQQPQEFRRKDGSVLEVEISATMQGEGSNARCLAILADVSARNNAQRRVVEQERLNRETLAYVPELIIRALPDTTVVFVNRKYCEFFGIAETEIVGRRATDALSPELAREVLDLIAAMTPENPLTMHENQQLRSDGALRWLAWTDRAIFGPDGRVIEIFSVGRDNTEARALSDNIRRQHQKLAALYRELSQAHENLSQFSRILSHDLREPLRKLVGYSDMLRETLDGDDPEEIEQAAGVIQNAAARAETMITDLLHYFRASDAELQRVPISLATLVDDVVRDLSADIEAAGATVEVAVDPAHAVSGDMVQVRQILQNLLANAVKYRKPGRPVEIRVSTSEHRRRGLSLDVADNGIGFDMQYQRRIFEPFRRLHSRDEYAGTGIGLAICATAARRHGWTIEVESRVDEGSTFSLVIPRGSVLCPTRSTRSLEATARP
ncbi:sensor histidine kinase [Prosthecomicrobium sp. N25]|uniref:sensor histidine kinase n=1 Tax=Prosthecomicrobium sp. N25 TaxID=3129254 RepID=UPI0030775111